MVGLRRLHKIKRQVDIQFTNLKDYLCSCETIVWALLCKQKRFIVRNNKIIVH